MSGPVVSPGGSPGPAGPTGGPGSPALPAGCPPSQGDAQQQIAQRVICAWEAGQLQAEVGRGITPEAAAKLAVIPPVPGGQAVRTATESFGVPEGARVSLLCTSGAPGGVVFLVVSSGLVTSTPDSPTKCP